MSKIIPGNQKHLSLEDRLFIEQSLNQGLSFKEIAKYLCKDPSTISKEVKKHRASSWYHKGSFLNKKNFCVHRYQCRKTNVCKKIILCGIKCTSCPSCNQTCKDFEKECCNRLMKAHKSFITAASPINIPMMPDLLIENTGKPLKTLVEE